MQGESTAPGEDPGKVPIYLSVPLAIFIIFVLRGAIMHQGMQRYLSMLKAFLILSVYSSGVSAGFALDNKVGFLKHVFSITSISLSTLPGCFITVFNSDSRVSILVLLSCIALALLYGGLTTFGLSTQQLGRFAQIRRAMTLTFGLIGARFIVRLAHWKDWTKFASASFLIGMAALIETLLGKVAYPEIGLYTLVWLGAICTSIPAFFLTDWNGRYFCLIGSVIAVSSLYPMNRVFLVYLVTACLLYRGLYGHDRYRCLWLSVVSSVLLGVSLLTTEGPSDDRALPLIVMAVFLFFTLICSKWLTAKLSRKTRFRVLFAGVSYFPVLACLSLGVKDFTQQTVYFDWFSMLHLAALPTALFTGWKGRTFSLWLSTVLVMGLAFGSEWVGSFFYRSND